MAKCCWCEADLQRWTALSPEGPWVCPTQACANRQWQHAILTSDKKGMVQSVFYVPTPRQVEWHQAVFHRGTTRLMVGGHAGPGKSKWIREVLYRFAMTVPGFHALLIRRTHKDLEQSHLRFVPKEVHDRGGAWKISEKVIEFPHPKGEVGIIRMGHLEDSGALQNYLSSEYDVIAPDELVTFDQDDMLELFSRARSTNPHLYALRGGHKFWAMNENDELEEMETDGSLVVTATNPAGRGSLWVKEFFIDKTPDREKFPNYQPAMWAFYGAQLKDNPYMRRGYVATLNDLPEIRRRQLLLGDWDAWEGQFFGEWRATTHVRTFALPKDLEYFGSMDWGFNSPGVMLWWACLPDGHYHIAREYKFQGDSAEVVAKTIKTITNEELRIKRLRYIACDPSMKSKTGHGKGESIMETLQCYGLPMRPSDNDRKNGWQRCHELLRMAPDGTPWLTVDERCTYGRRTIPAQLQDEKDPDDLDTKGDDHWCLVAGTRVTTERGEVPIERVTLQDRVWAGSWWAAVQCVAKTADSVPVMTLVLDDGQFLTGTGAHPVFVADRGFQRMDSLRYGDILASCPDAPQSAWNPWSFAGWCSGVIRILNGWKTDATTSRMGTGLRAVWRHCTARFGSTRTGQSPRNIT